MLFPLTFNADPNSPLIEFSKLQLSTVTPLDSILTESPYEFTNFRLLKTTFEEVISKIWVKKPPSKIAPFESPLRVKVLFKMIFEFPQYFPLRGIISFSSASSTNF